jgi:hypothetical protein
MADRVSVSAPRAAARGRDQPAGVVEDETVGAAKQLGADDGAAVRRVHETAVPDVEADVSRSAEDEDVTGAEVSPPHVPSHTGQRIARVWEPEADARESPVHEPGAIEARDRGRTAVAVGDASLCKRCPHHTRCQ